MTKIPAKMAAPTWHTNEKPTGISSAPNSGPVSEPMRE